MWYVIKQSDSNGCYCIYIGKSKKKAERIAKENEDINNYIYCYVGYYKKTEHRRGNKDGMQIL